MSLFCKSLTDNLNQIQALANARKGRSEEENEKEKKTLATFFVNWSYFDKNHEAKMESNFALKILLVINQAKISNFFEKFFSGTIVASRKGVVDKILEAVAKFHGHF